MSDVAVAGSIAAALTCAQVARQVYDAERAADVAAVSEVTWTLALIQSCGLVVFTVDGAFYEAAVADAFVACGCAAILLLLGRKRSRSVLRAVGPIAAVSAIVAGCTMAVDARLAGTIGAIAAVFVWLPQAARSVIVRTGAGLSLPFMLAGFASSALWIVYASLLDQWRLLVAPIAAIMALSITLLFSFVRPTTGGAVS
jgi:uncharacterized protein with PQ loop repeat